jgi:type I restriction enzyme S subunit
LRLYPEAFSEIMFPVPPLEDQMRIDTHLKAETAKLDILTRAIERTIKLLGEKHAAVTAAAVTGQLPIPGSADGLPSEEEMACSSTT